MLSNTALPVVQSYLHKLFFRPLVPWLLLCYFPASTVTAQTVHQPPRISIHVKQQPVIAVLQLISKKTGVPFFYNIEEMKRLPAVSLKIRNETIDNILLALFKGKGFYGALTNGVMAITPNKATGMPAKEITGETSSKVPDNNGQPLQLNEVVISGYVTLAQRHSAAAVTTIKGNSLERTDLFTADKLLQGKVPGLNITFNNTLPGAAPKIRLRGTTTLLGNREPVWVIDGIITDPPVKLSASEINSLDNVNLLSTAAIGLNPQDIERIDVLKDAVATALYGVNGGNGVIVVTTKKGTFNRPPKVTFSQFTNILFKPSYHRFNLMNGPQRMALSKEIMDKNLTFVNAAFPVGSFEYAYQAYKAQRITPEAFATQEQFYKTVNTDWFNLLFDNGVNQSTNVSVSGGSARNAYYLSLGYGSQQGPAIFTNAKRYSGMVHMDSRLRPGLQVGIKLSGSLNKGMYPYQVDPFQYAYKTSRNLPFTINNQRQYYSAVDFLPQGIKTEDLALFNIMTELEKSRTHMEVSSYDVTANADWRFLKKFQLHGLYGFAASRSQNASYAEEETYYVANRYRFSIARSVPLTDSLKQGVIFPRGGGYRQTNNNRRAYTIRHSLEFADTVGPHFIQVMAGSEIRENRYDIAKQFIAGYYPDSGKVSHIPPADEYPSYSAFYALGNAAPLENYYKRYRQLSWYGMLIYTFKDRYTINLHAREDGSNSFAGSNGNPSLLTWSAAFRWGLSDEPWFPGGKNRSLLALRLSYGSNNGIPENVSPGNTTNQPVRDPISGEEQVSIASFAPPALRWEKTRTLNAGIDFSFFNNRLSGTVEVYRKQSADLLAQVDVSEVNGINTFTLNRAGMVNYGYEAGLQGSLLQNKNWNWVLGVNLSFNYTRIRQSNYTDPGNINDYQHYLDGDIIKSGTNPNTLYAFQFTGLDQKGLPTFHGLFDRDYSVQPTIPAYYANVFVPVGHRLPVVDGSVTTSLRYKRWRIAAVFLVKLGYRQRLTNLYGAGGYVPNAFENASAEIGQRWQQPGDEKHTNIPALSDQLWYWVFDPVTSSNIQSASVYPTWIWPYIRSVSPLYLMSMQGWQLYNQSDVRTVNASHVRLSSLALQYTLYSDQRKKCLFSNLSAYIQGNDLLVIASRRFHGQDPELAPGSMPRLPSLTLGLDITF